MDPSRAFRRTRAFVLGTALALAAPGTAFADPGVSDALRARVTALRADADVRVDGEEIAARRLIAEFYVQRGFRPAWAQPERARALLAAVEESRTHGLDPADYHVEFLRRAATGAPHGAEADRELVLTDALVRLAYHLRFGKANPRELYPDWNFSRTLGAIEPVPALEALVTSARLEEAVERLAPQLVIYRELRAALARYRGIAAAGGWPPVPPGPTLDPGMRDPRVAALRTRLAASGDLARAEAAEPDVFDAALDAAVRRFQQRHGLEDDGRVGRKTIAALDVGVGQRIDEIRANLERLRWVAQDIAGDFLVVDVAGFTASLYLDGSPAWHARVVVGQPYRRTPAFRATMDHLVLNPTWTVPPTIFREDVLPKLVRDPRYLAANHMRVVDHAGRAVDAATIRWSEQLARGFPYQIVQAPGGSNPLGEVKFMFPNSHSVYLHDTPARALFRKAERAFSSGCIRIERPLELATLLLDDPARWSAEALAAAIATGETRTVPVKRRVAVMLLYFTAAPYGHGDVQFRRDLYGRDARVLAALAQPFRFSPVDRRR
ncbi:MAG: L,D-transpeptidase family protein [Burkholderiales bacterium]|nr:L,D-transpeptidase family protein [Burkholderiales bacterium]